MEIVRKIYNHIIIKIKDEGNNETKEYSHVKIFMNRSVKTRVKAIAQRD